jgi:hypothetical protein
MDLYTLNKMFYDFHSGLYETMVIEYTDNTVYIKIQENGYYTFMNKDHILVDLTSDNMLSFLLNPLSSEYKYISFK